MCGHGRRSATLEILRNSRGQDLVATLENEQVGRPALSMQRLRELPACLGNVAGELPGIRVIPAVHRSGEGWDAAKLAYDVGVGIGRPQTGEADAQLRQLVLEPANGVVMMPAPGAERRVDDQGSHDGEKSLCHGGRHHSTARWAIMVRRHRRLNSQAR